MDSEDKNHYQFIYSRNTSFSLRFVGLFIVVIMFAAIPLAVFTINQQTNTNSHAAVMAAVTTPTDTPATGGTSASLTLVSPAISTSGGNTQPLHPSRLVTLKLYNIDKQQTTTVQDSVTFNGTNAFTNQNFNLGSIPTGNYEILLYMPGNLQKVLTQANGTNTFAIQAGTALTIPSVTLIPGDIGPIPGSNGQPYGDNILDISDYNVLIGCYGDNQTTSSCNDVAKVAADLNDDGKIDAVDYNILLRSFATRDGDSLPILSATSGTITPSITAAVTATPTLPAGTATPTVTIVPTATTTIAPTATNAPVHTNTPTPTIPSASGVICSSSSNPQCSYAVSCSTTGVTCQCADRNWSGHDKVYQCQSGSWKYINDTTQSSQYVCTSPCGNY